MSRQTTIQDLSSIIKGSVRVLIGDDFSSLVDIGALRDPVLTALTENQEVEFDNVKSLFKFVEGKRFQFQFTLAEINLTNLATLNSELINLTVVNGTLVSGAEQVVASGAWNFDEFIPLENQNADGSEPTINSLTGSVDGALVEDTDFQIIESNGKWGIAVFNTGSGGVTTEDQSLTINYDYTPAESKELTFNETGTMGERVMRIVNTDEDGKTFTIDIENGSNFEPFTIDFAGDLEEDVATQAINFQGDIVKITDEQ